MSLSIEATIGEIIANHKTEIIDRAVDKLAGRLAKLSLRDAEDELRARTTNAIDKIVSEQVNELLKATFHETDSWGSPRSDKKFTLIEMILDRATKWLHEKVDSYGRQTTSSDGKTRVQWLTSSAAEQLIKNQLQPEIDKASKEFKATVQGKLLGAFQKTLTECMKP